MQQLSQHTNNRYTLSVINIDSLETYIDYRKLQFLGQLCRLSPQYQAKSVFHHRLLRYINKDRQCLGFVPDIFRIVRKYNLQYVLDTYIRQGSFPSKCRWKTILISNLHKPTERERIDYLLDVFPNYPTAGKSNNVWSVARSNPKLTPLIAKLVRIAGSLLSREFTQRCSLCNLLAKQVTVHKICFCMANRDRQIKLWDTVIQIHGLNTYITLTNLGPYEQCIYLLNNVFSTVCDDQLNTQSVIALCNAVL